MSEQQLNASAESEFEEPEALDSSEGAYPLNDLEIRTANRTLVDVVRKMAAGFYVMDPDFQRGFVWNSDKQSKLIESALMRIPLPVIYLAETPEGKLVVVDGRQRLTTFSNYLNDRFSLRLSPDNELNGKKFTQLPSKLQNRLEDTQLILYIIDHKVPERARLDIFERVNGGEPLTRQQMRNCIYNGRATKMLRDLSETQEFKLATRDKLDSKTMRDREVINRFLGFFTLGLSAYKGDMDEFLAQALRHANGLPPSQIDEIKQFFVLSMKNNYMLFHDHAFRKHTGPGERRNPINIALFDVFSVAMTKWTETEIKTHGDAIRSAFYQLMSRDDFFQAVSYSTNSTNRVLTRFEAVNAMLKRVRDAQ